MKRWTCLFALLLCAVSCGRQPRPVTSRPEAGNAPLSAVFRPALAPASLPVSERAAYMRAHYWDGFDFADTAFLARVDTGQMVEAFAAYVALYVDPADPAPVDSLMRRASASRPMLDYFRMLAEQVLYDPNSPLRNDELYIPVLEATLASPWYDEWERIAPASDLQLARQNRIGRAANDFRYTLPSGRHGTLYGIEAEYTLVVFTNPDCPMCHRLREELMASPRLCEMAERDELVVLAVYPDEDVALWREQLRPIPAGWIDAFDEGCAIRGEGLYDLKAIPSLYLLDRDKRVLVKDAAAVPGIEEAIDRNA